MCFTDVYDVPRRSNRITALSSGIHLAVVKFCIDGLSLFQDLISAGF